MAELPYFPFYPRDFASDGAVEAMSTKAVGAYTLLLCKAWFENPPGTLPDDDSTLSKWARLSDLDWQSIKSEVLRAFHKSGDRWRQKRMAAEHELAVEKHTRRSKAGQKGGLAKAKQRLSNATAMPEQCSSKPSDSDSYSVSGFGSSPDPENTNGVPMRLLWNQVQPIWDAYPRINKGSKGEFAIAVGVAWGQLAAEGDPNPGETILKATKAYAMSWKARQDGGKFTVGPDRFFAHNGHYRNDPADWGKPKENGSIDMGRVKQLMKENAR